MVVCVPKLRTHIACCMHRSPLQCMPGSVLASFVSIYADVQTLRQCVALNYIAFIKVTSLALRALVQ